MLCSNCYSKFQRKQKQIKLENEEKQRKEQKEKYQKMSIPELIRELGNPNKEEKIMSIQELGKREDIEALYAVMDALNIEGGYSLESIDWKYYVYLDIIPNLGKLGGDQVLNELIKFREKCNEKKIEASETLRLIENTLEMYEKNPNARKIEGYKKKISEMTSDYNWLKDFVEKNQIILDTLEEAIKKLTAKKFEKMADRIESNFKEMN